MYSDRELLALAAKAAGILLCGYSWIGENEDDDECEILEAAFVKHHQEQELASKWNPLTDDGDALRLAVCLGIDIEWQHDSGYVKVYRNKPSSAWSGYISELFCVGDAMHATRRAIVRAAAAIGETK